VHDTEVRNEHNNKA